MGHTFKLLWAAYNDFSKEANPDRAQEIAKEYGQDSFTSYGSNLENYIIIVGSGSKGYTVTFQLRLSDKYPSVVGQRSTTYLVDPKTFKIISFSKQK